MFGLYLVFAEIILCLLATGNSEVHLDDLCAADPILKARMDQILQTKVYPLVRSAFSNEIGADGDNATPIGPICVYDSVSGRYAEKKH